MEREKEREREREKCFGFINNADSRERGAKPFELFRCPSIRPAFCRQVADDKRGTGGSGRNGRPREACDRAPALCCLPAAFHRKGERLRAGILFGSVLDAVRRWRGHSGCGWAVREGGAVWEGGAAWVRAGVWRLLTLF
jgi:hypothetical protein